MAITQQFIVVGTYRTGSTALAHALNRHPEIICALEWTEGLWHWRALPIAKRAMAGDFDVLSAKHQRLTAEVYDPSKSALGFKKLFRASNKWLFQPAFGPLLLDGLQNHMKWIRSKKDFRVIHIVRNDHLAWLRSKAFSDATGAYFKKSYPDDLQVSMSPREAVRRVRAKMYIDRQLATLGSTTPYLRVDYEAFAADNYGKTCEMVEFLGYDPADLKSREKASRKQAKPNHVLTNEAEIAKALESLSGA